MSEQAQSPASVPVVVRPVADAPRPFRRVSVLGTHVGKAYSLADVIEFARRSGLDNLDYQDPDTVQWQGGGPDDWQYPA